MITSPGPAPSDNFQSFREVARNALVSVEVRRANRGPFTRFDVRRTALRGMRIYDIVIDPAIIERRPVDIARDAVEDYFLTIQLEGESRIQQRGKELITRRCGATGRLSSGFPGRSVRPLPPLPAPARPPRRRVRRGSRRRILSVPSPESNENSSIWAREACFEHFCPGEGEGIGPDTRRGRATRAGYPAWGTFRAP